MGLEQFEEFETDSHPLSSRNVFGAAIGDAADQVDAVLLHLLVSVLQDRGQPGKEIEKNIYDHI